MRFTGIVLVVAVLTATTSPSAMMGNGFTEGTLKPQHMVQVHVPVTGHQTFYIQVTGNGGDLDCYLYRGKEPSMPFGKFVTRDDTARDGCDLRVKSDRDEVYLLLVQNSSNHDEHYVVSTR